MTDEELRALARTVDAHSLVIGVLFKLLLENRIPLKRDALKVLESLRTHPNWTPPEKARALQEAIEVLRGMIPMLH